MIACGQCGSENPDGFRFCGACAAPFGASAREVRKVISVVFCDVVGSTPLGERLDAEVLRDVMGQYFTAMRTVVEGHGGRVEKFIGDAVVAVFGVPDLHEDDALRAVRAADEMRRRVPELNDSLRSTWGVEIAARLGVSTGSVVAAAADEVMLGDVLNTAARLQQEAAAGEVVVGQATYRLVGHCVTAEAMGALSLKGKREDVHAWRVESIDPHAAFVARALDRPLIGRARELALLLQTFERVAEEGESALATVFGQPGIGKSRLAFELMRSVRSRASVLQGTCASYGHGITYAPVAEMLRQIAPDASALRQLLLEQGDAERVAQTVVAALGMGDEDTDGEETFWAFRRVFEALAESTPVVLVVEDVHWAEPTLLDLIEYLLECLRERPLMVVCLARPEFLEQRPGWGGGRVNGVSLMLKELSGEDSEHLLLGGALGREISAAMRSRIAAAARGVPLFLEQMSAMLAETGQIEDGDIPPAVQALLGARLDALDEHERALLEHASIEGEAFSVAGLAALVPDDPAEMARRLHGLARRQLVRDTGDGRLRFAHGLIRDVAYARLPKVRRSILHERHGAWLEQSGATGELVGFHLERAVLLRAELGPVDDDARALARQASRLLVEAGRRADQRADDAAAANLFGRAVALLAADDAARLRLLPELGAILGQADPRAALTVLDEAIAGPASPATGPSSGMRSSSARSCCSRAIPTRARSAIFSRRHNKPRRSLPRPVTTMAPHARSGWRARPSGCWDAPRRGRSSRARERLSPVPARRHSSSATPRGPWSAGRRRWPKSKEVVGGCSSSPARTRSPGRSSKDASERPSLRRGGSTRGEP